MGISKWSMSTRRSEQKSWGFRGSPTVLINGGDPFLDTDAPVGLSCRIYPTDKDFQGTPPEEALRAAIALGIGA